MTAQKQILTKIDGAKRMFVQDQAAMVPPLDRTWMIGSWPVHEYQIPIIIGISSGVLILLLIIAVLIAWRCCHIHRLHEKTFGITSQLMTDDDIIFISLLIDW